MTEKGSDSSSLQANFIVYGQQNSCFDGFCGVWTIKMDVSNKTIQEHLCFKWANPHYSQ